MKLFPIMVSGGTKGPCPSVIPWDAISPYEGMARENHGGQSLERLAERGGLDPVEAFFVMTGRTWHNVQTPVLEELEREACAYLDKIVKDRSDLAWRLSELMKECDCGDMNCCLRSRQRLISESRHNGGEDMLNLPKDKDYPPGAGQCDACGGTGCVICSHKGWLPWAHPRIRLCFRDGCGNALRPDSVAVYCSNECAGRDA